MINNISFGANLLAQKAVEIKNADVDKKDLLLGAGAGGAVGAATKGKDIYNVARGTLSTIGKTTKTANEISKTAKTVSFASRFRVGKAFFMGAIENLSKMKYIKPIAGIVKFKPVQIVAGAAGGFFAVATCIADFANIFNVATSVAEKNLGLK